MDKQAVIRRVRIAVSVFFVTLTVALCVLWVRSYYVGDLLDFAPNSSNKLLIQSATGKIKLYWSDTQQWSPTYRRFHNRFAVPAFDAPLPFSWRGFQAPHWVFISALVAIAVAPWIKGRFSLRTLLIATTLVAVMLGLVVWTLR